MRAIIYFLFGCISILYIGYTFEDTGFLLSILTSLYMPICLMFFLRKIDIFETETWKDLLLIFMTGCVITYLFTLTLSIRDSIFPGLQTDSPSFIDMLIGVATIEEIVKIIPVLIIIKITKLINEPIDYLIYASVSALGFAFLENIDYIYAHKDAHINIVGIRSFMPTVMHVFTTSIIGAGIYKFQKENKYKFLIIGFGSAILAHTIYNLYFPWYTLVTLSVYYGVLMKNLLKESPFLDIAKITNEEDKRNSLKTDSQQKTEQVVSVKEKGRRINKLVKWPNSGNTKFILKMLFGVFIIDTIFEYTQSGTYNVYLLILLMQSAGIFLGFFQGPLNKGDIKSLLKKNKEHI